MLTWPHPSGADFPVPRLSEGFIDDVVERAGGKRMLSCWTPPQSVQNADYLFPGGIAELKVLEEEGLLKATRQDKLASLFRRLVPSDDAMELDFDEIPPDIKGKVEDVLLEPIQGAVRKAARQLSDTRQHTGFGDRCTVLIAVNSGYSSLPAELFERLVLRSCHKDTSQIDFLVCLSVHYHQGDFDAFVFFRPTASPIRATTWPEAEAFLSAAQTKFGEAMTEMMRDQMNPELWTNHLHPVRDIVFDRDGVTYARSAPPVPDSRFE